MKLADWNARYRSREEIDHDPAALLVRATSTLPPGRALDLACGAGRNAIWLMERGWDVVAIDGADEAIRLVREQAPSLDARVMDLETGAPLPFDDESFDLVAILFFLHRPLFAEAKRVLRRGGVIVCSALMRGTYRIAPGELESHFADCEVLLSTENEIAEIVARKG
jgi:SAM-dependent methyltransferase